MKQGSLRLQTGKLSKEYTRAVARGETIKLPQNIMSRKAGVFTKKAAIRKLIANRLGWVDSAALMRKKVPEIETFGRRVVAGSTRHVVLMGMGGSSLCPELFKFMYGKQSKLKSFDVIDSTDPVSILAIRKKIDIKKTLFIVASKSGGTVETRSHEAFFIDELKKSGVKAFGRHFVAITDKGSALQSFARRHKYRKIFVNPSDIGGRYSSLSYFGLVAGFFAGVNLRGMLDDALIMQQTLATREGEANPGLALGSLMAVAARAGRNKLTFVATKSCAPFVPWVEQLVAESTGKQRKGIVPIENESPASPAAYGNDRLMVFFRMNKETVPAQSKMMRDLTRRHIPFVEITMANREELGRQFLLWEMATAVVGYHMNINPFDEPNVTESKNNTNAILDKFLKSGAFPYAEPIAEWSGLSLHAVGGAQKINPALMANPVKCLKRFFRGAKPPHYFAALNYYRSDKKSETELARLREVVRAKTKMATLRGYGPRFLHSIGQLYKGGPPDGLFVIFLRRKYGQLDIPGKPFTFGQLIEAQGLGDAQGLMKRKLPTLLIRFDGSPAKAVATFTRLLRRAL